MTVNAQMLSADGVFLLRFQDEIVEDDLDWTANFLATPGPRSDRFAIVDATRADDIDLTLREFTAFIGRLRRVLAQRDDMLTVYIVTSQDVVRTFVRLFTLITAPRKLVEISVVETVASALNAAGVPPRDLVASVPVWPG